MLPLSYSSWTALRDAKTGLPGSRRQPRLIGPDSGGVTLAINTQTTLDPQLYHNDDSRVYFITHFIVSSQNNVALRMRIKPSNSEPWSRDLVSVASISPGSGIKTTSSFSATIMMPEPYPLIPGASLEISLGNFDSGNNIGSLTVLVGVVGYFETIPAYTKPRKTPYYLYSAIPTSLANNKVTSFNRADLHPGFTFVGDYLTITAYNNLSLLDMYLVYARINISKQLRVLETRVPYTVLTDRPDVGGAIPLYGTVLSKHQEFIVDIENQTGSSITTSECLVAGYRI